MVKMRPGDIVFVRGTSPISKIIRLFDKGEFSHCAIAVSETHVLEAQWFTRARITPFYFKNYEIVEMDLSDSERQSIIGMSIQLVGKWYDYPQIIGYIFNYNFNNPNNLICSEMIAVILSKLGKFEYSQVVNLKPNELYKLLKETRE